MKTNHKFNLWIFPLIFFSLFIIIAIVANNFEYITKLDTKIIIALQSALSFVDIKVWDALSNIHHNYFGLVIVLATLFLIYKRDYNLAILYFVCDYNCKYVTTFVKGIFQRQRPPIELQPLSHPETFSFPSGHSFNIMVFLGFLMIIIFKYVGNKVLKYLLISVCAVLILLVGLSRNMLGVHYPTDVIAGFLFGLTLLSVVCIIDNKHQD